MSRGLLAPEKWMDLYWTKEQRSAIKMHFEKFQTWRVSRQPEKFGRQHTVIYKCWTPVARGTLSNIRQCNEFRAVSSICRRFTELLMYRQGLSPTVEDRWSWGEQGPRRYRCRRIFMESYHKSGFFKVNGCSRVYEVILSSAHISSECWNTMTYSLHYDYLKIHTCRVWKS